MGTFEDFRNSVQVYSCGVYSQSEEWAIKKSSTFAVGWAVVFIVVKVAWSQKWASCWTEWQTSALASVSVSASAMENGSGQKSERNCKKQTETAKRTAIDALPQASNFQTGDLQAKSYAHTHKNSYPYTQIHTHTHIPIQLAGKIKS